MKKLLATLLLVAMCVTCVSMFASCSDDGTGTGGVDFVVPEEGYTGEAVEITFYHSMGATLRAVLEEAIVEFNKLYPNITVKHQSLGDYDGVRDQIKTQLTAGTQPNIAYCYPDHVALYNIAKAVISMDNLIASEIVVARADGTTETVGFTQEQLNDFVAGYYAEGAVYDAEGTMYTLPMSKSTEALYYDKTFFAKNGLSVPTTWEEMEALCARILEIDPTCIPLGYDSEANWFITMCEQYGSPYTSHDEDNHFVFDNETNHTFVEMFNRWYRSGYITTEAIYGAYTSGLFTSTTGQRCYMVIGSTGGASYQTPPQDGDGNYLFQTGMAMIPQVDPANPKVISQGPSLCIFGDSNAQEVVASWLFVKYLTTNVQFQAKFSMKSGYAPVIKSVQNDPVYQAWLDASNSDGVDEETGLPVWKTSQNLTALSVKQALAQNDAYYVSPAFNGSSVARDQVGILLQDALVVTGDNISAQIDALFKKAINECEYSQ